MTRTTTLSRWAAVALISVVCTLFVCPARARDDAGVPASAGELLAAEPVEEALVPEAPEEAPAAEPGEPLQPGEAIGDRQVVVAALLPQPGLLGEAEASFLIDAMRSGLSLLPRGRYAVVAVQVPTEGAGCDTDCLDALVGELGGRHALIVRVVAVGEQLGVSAELRHVPDAQVVATLTDLTAPEVGAVHRVVDKAVRSTVEYLSVESAPPPVVASAPAPVLAPPPPQAYDLESRPRGDSKKISTLVLRIGGHVMLWHGIASMGGAALAAFMGGGEAAIAGGMAGGLTNVLGGIICFTQMGLTTGAITEADYLSLRLGPGIYGLHATAELFTLYWDRVYWTVMRSGFHYGWAAFGPHWGTSVGYPFRLSERADLRVGVGVDGGVVFTSNMFGRGEVMDVPHAYGPMGLVEVIFSRRLARHFAFQVAFELQIYTMTDGVSELPYRPPYAGLALGFAI